MNTPPEIVWAVQYNEEGELLPLTTFSGNEVLIEIFSSGVVNGAEGDSYSLHSHILPAEGAFLQKLIKENNSKRALEIGLAFGISAMFICEALSENGGEIEYKAVDPEQEDYWHNVGITNIQRSGFDDIFQFIEEGAEFCLPPMVKSEERFDFIFIDGRHEFEHVLVNFFYCDQLLLPGGILVFDDANYTGVEEVINRISQDSRYGDLKLLRYPNETPEMEFNKMAAFRKK